MGRRTDDQRAGASSAASDRPGTSKRNVRDRLVREANAAYAEGRLDDAETLGQAALHHSPQYPPALHLLGTIAAANGDRALAVRLLGEAVSLDQQLVDARNALATQLLGMRNTAEAIAVCQTGLKLTPNSASLHNTLGLSYLASWRLPEATASFKQAIRCNAHFASAHYHLGTALQHQGRSTEARASFQAALRLAPDLVDAHFSLGMLLLSEGKRADGIAALRNARALQPRAVNIALRLAELVLDDGRVAEAEELLRQVISIDPTAGEAWRRLGRLLQQRGLFAEAVAAFEQAIVLQPKRTSPYLGLVTARIVSDADQPLLDRMSSLLREEGLADRERVNLHYALGKSFDDLGRYEAAMRQFDEANRIARQSLAATGRVIDRSRHVANIDRLIALFTPELFARSAALGSSSERPLLVVGMIRSGTTLAEQILSSHPAIAAGGELRFWGEHGALLSEVESGAFGPVAASRLAQDYSTLLQAHSQDALRVTDKMPTNFFLAGLIHLVFPRARIIHCRRHPVDTCLSVYFTSYPNLPDFAHDRGNIVFYYQQYQRLMAHWRRVLPNECFMDIDYEELVTDRPQFARRMIGFCGLEWDDACLRHEDNSRVIQTPSLWQARQPVHTGSVARWRHYEQWLGEFAALLPAPSPAP